MNQTLKWALHLGMVFVISGCEAFKDQTYYEGSEYSRVQITQLQKGFKIEGSGRYKDKEGEYIKLYFCKNNRYKLINYFAKLKEGDFTIDTQKGTITLIGDDTDNAGNPMKGTILTGNGYIAQKKKLQVIGRNMDFEIYKVHQINSSDCSDIR